MNPDISELLPGSERFRRKEPEWKTGNSLIDRANKVDVVSVMEDFLSLRIPREVRSWKTYCPWGGEHPDGGKLDKGFRVYPGTNSTYCFVQHGSMGPVKLVSMALGVKYKVAALKILERYNLLKPRAYQERMADLLQETKEQQSSLGDPVYVVEALWTSLQNVEGFSSRQFDSDFMELTEQELVKLDAVLANPESTVENLRAWYENAKRLLLASIQL